MDPAPVPSTDRDVVGFGDFELDVRTGELWRDRCPVTLRPLAARALIALVTNAGRVVSRDELRRLLWPDAVVAWDQSLNQCVRQVRRALGDDAAAPVFVETVPRRGYRFRAAVVRGRVGSGRRSARSASSSGAGSRALVAFLAGAATTLAIPVILLVICSVL